MKKSTMTAGIAATVLLFIFGYLFYGLSGIMDGYMSEDLEAISRGDDMNFIFLILGHAVWGFVLSMIYSKWARGVHSFGQGFELGAMIALILGLGMILVWHATSTMYTSMLGIVIESVWNIVAWGITGGVVSIIYGKTEQPSD